ncbi:MAG: FAD-binding oxidoreductase, partial [Rhizomicrobium sp.]
QDKQAMLGMARAVLASAPNLFAGIAQLARMGVAGTRAMKNAGYMLHFILDGVDDAEAKAKLARLRAVMAPGWEIPNTVPTVVRGMPFAPLRNTLGPKGERWVPLHGVLAHARAAAFHEALLALYGRHAGDMRRLGVWTGGMFETVGSSGFLYEVAIYWPGARTAYHEVAISADILSRLPIYADDPEVSTFVARLKDEITALYGTFGAVHFQLGKIYPYADVLQPQPLALLKAVKAQLDPAGLMNPGALGL